MKMNLKSWIKTYNASKSDGIPPKHIGHAVNLAVFGKAKEDGNARNVTVDPNVTNSLFYYPFLARKTISAYVDLLGSPLNPGRIYKPYTVSPVRAAAKLLLSIPFLPFEIAAVAINSVETLARKSIAYIANSKLFENKYQQIEPEVSQVNNESAVSDDENKPLISVNDIGVKLDSQLEVEDMKIPHSIKLLSTKTQLESMLNAIENKHQLNHIDLERVNAFVVSIDKANTNERLSTIEKRIKSFGKRLDLQVTMGHKLNNYYEVSFPGKSQAQINEQLKQGQDLAKKWSEESLEKEHEETRQKISKLIKSMSREDLNNFIAKLSKKMAADKSPDQTIKEMKEFDESYNKIFRTAYAELNLNPKIYSQELIDKIEEEKAKMNSAPVSLKCTPALDDSYRPFPKTVKFTDESVNEFATKIATTLDKRHEAGESKSEWQVTKATEDAIKFTRKDKACEFDVNANKTVSSNSADEETIGAMVASMQAMHPKASSFTLSAPSYFKEIIERVCARENVKVRFQSTDNQVLASIPSPKPVLTTKEKVEEKTQENEQDVTNINRMRF